MSNTDTEGATTEAVAHQVLRVVADFPGQMGRHRAARIVSGLPVTVIEGDPDMFASYVAQPADWPLKEFVAMVDALLAGGLLAQTIGQRPTLVLTRVGFRALEALEHVELRDTVMANAAKLRAGEDV